MSTKNYTDITKTGAQRGNELTNEINKDFNNPEQPPLTLEQARAMRRAKKTNILPQKTYSSIYQQSGGTDYFGSSMFDEDIVIGTEAVNNLGDIRAENQPWYAQLGAGVAKGAVLAGTTFIDGTLGLVVGVGTAISEGRISGLWDNTMSNTMSQINKELETILPNYRTQAELERPWYQNMGTMNFWADSFIKNVGFTVGALYSGKAWLGALKALNLVKGATAAKGIGTFMSAFNEGRIEANHAHTEFYENEAYQINAARDKQAIEILESPIDAFTKENLLQQLDNNTQLLLQDAEERASGVGLTTLIGNTALLTASNLIQFGKLYSRGFENATNLSKNATKQGNKYAWKNITKKQAIGKGLLNSATEGFEEMNQALISETAGYWHVPDSPDSYYKALQDPDARMQTNDFISALALGMTNSYGNGDRWEEFAIGALTGFLGVPTFGKVQNSDANTYLGRGKTIGLSGGLFGEISQANKMNREGQEAVNIVNKYLSKLDDKLNYFTLNQSFTNAMDGWASSNNKFEFINASNNDDFAAIAAFAKLGKLQDFKDMINQDFENLDEASLKDIAINTTPDINIDNDDNVVTNNPNASPKQGGWRNVDGTLMSDTPEGREEMKEELIKKRDKILQEVDKYEKAVRQVRAIGNDSLDESRVEELAWLLWKQEIFKDRYESMREDYLWRIQKLLDSVKPFISEETSKEGGKKLDLSTKSGQTILKNLESVQAYLEALENADNIMIMSNIIESNPEYLNYMINDAYGNTILEELSGLNSIEFKKAITDLADIGKIANAAKTFQERFKAFTENPLVQIKNRDKIKNKANQVIQNRKTERTKNISNAIAKRINFDASAIDIATSIQENMSDIDSVGGLDAWLKTLPKEQQTIVKKALKVSEGLGIINETIISEFKENNKEVAISTQLLEQAASEALTMEDLEKKAYEFLDKNIIDDQIELMFPNNTDEENLIMISRIKDSLKEIFDDEFPRIQNTIEAIERAEKAKEAKLEEEANLVNEFQEKEKTIEKDNLQVPKDKEPEEISIGEEVPLITLAEGELLEIKGAIDIEKLGESSKEINNKVSSEIQKSNSTEYNRPQLTEVYLHGYGETYLDFIKNNDKYIPEGVDKEAYLKYIEATFKYLKKENAFDNVKNYLYKGAPLEFYVDPQLNEDAGTFIVLIRTKDSEGHTYVVGSMPSEIDFNSKSKYLKNGKIEVLNKTLAERNLQRYELFNQIKKTYSEESHSIDKVYYTTQVDKMMGGTLPRIKENNTVSTIALRTGEPIIIGVTNKEGKVITGNPTKDKMFLDSGYSFNKIEGQVYIGIFSPTTEKYLPALAYSTPLSKLINNKEDWYIKETVKVLIKAVKNLKTTTDDTTAGLLIKSWLNFPSLGAKIGKRVKGKWIKDTINPTNLVLNITNKAGKKITVPIPLEDGKLTEENAYKAIQTIIKNAGDITTNVITSALNNTDYITNISKYLNINMSKLSSVNDWFTYVYNPEKTKENTTRITEEAKKEEQKNISEEGERISIGDKTYIILNNIIFNEFGSLLEGAELQQVKYYLELKNKTEAPTQEKSDTTKTSGIKLPTINKPVAPGTTTPTPSPTTSSRAPKRFLLNTATSDIIAGRNSILQDTEALKKMFPTLSKEGKIRLVDGLIKTIDEKGNPVMAYGMFKDGILYISDKSPKGTAFHEAFHYITDMLLNEEETQMMFQEAELQYNSIDKIELEERLAEAFRDYMNGMLDPSLRGTLKRLFIKIKHIINNLLGKEIYLDNLFYKIYRGRLSSRPERVSTSNTKYLTTEAIREMQAIKDKAIADGTFMKASNGNHTNLNEMQWLQVRTKAFKDWFGDWEKIAPKRIRLGKIIPTLDSYGNIEKYGQQGETDLETREVIDEKGNIIGTVRMEFRGLNRNKTVVLHPQLNIKGKGYGQELYQLIANIYNIPVEESFGIISKSKESQNMWNSMMNKGIAIFNNDDEIPLRQVIPNNNASKVVDENGEPLVVYHGSKRSFDVFNKSIITNRVNGFFTNNKLVASSYEKDRNENIYDIEPKSYFLNIRSPKITDAEGKTWGYETKKHSIYAEEALPTENENYDGAIILNIDDYKSYEDAFGAINDYDSMMDAELEEIPEDIIGNDYVVNDPNQIKSATDNEGIFSTKNDNIYDSFENDLLIYRYRKTDYSNLDNDTKHYLQEKGISEEEYQNLSANQREYLLHCM